MQELSQKCLSFARESQFDSHTDATTSSSPQAIKLQVLVPIEELSLLIQKISSGEETISYNERRTLLKVFGRMIDGSTLGFTELSRRIEEGLLNSGIKFQSENLEAGMCILDILASKQQLFAGIAPQSVKNDGNETFFQLRNLEEYKMDQELDQMCDRQSLRRHMLNFLETLQSYLQKLESDGGDLKATLLAIDEAERIYSEAKSRLNQEMARLERKADHPRAPGGGTSVQKHAKLDNQSVPVKASSSNLESAVKSQVNDTQAASSSGNQANAQNQQQIPNKNAVLTAFFGPKKEHKFTSELSRPPAEKNLFRCLGSQVLIGGNWTEEQANHLEGYLTKQRHGESTINLWQELVMSARVKRTTGGNWQQAHAAAQLASTEPGNTQYGPIGSTPELKPVKYQVPPPRFIFLKEEDHLLNTLGFSGVFRPKPDMPAELCSKLIKDPLLKLPGVDYEADDSDDEIGDAESIGSKDEDDEEASNQSLDDEEKDDFIVPDGYLSDDEVDGSNDAVERNLHLQKKPKKKRLDKLEMRIQNFCEDPSSGSAYAAIPIGIFPTSQLTDAITTDVQGQLTFPLRCSESATEGDELNDEVMKELIRELHCCVNKGQAINKVSEKYKYVSKTEMKLRADESCVQGVIIDPAFYKKAGYGIEKYLTDISRIFTPELYGIDHRLSHAMQELPASLSDSRQNGQLSERDSATLAISTNGLPARAIGSAQTPISFLNQNPGLKKAAIERKLKEIAVCLFIVRKDVFDTYLESDKPKVSTSEPATDQGAERSWIESESTSIGEWFNSINKYFRVLEANSSTVNLTQPPSNATQEVSQIAPEVSQKIVITEISILESGKNSIASKNRNNSQPEASQSSFKNQDIRELLKSSSVTSPNDLSNLDDSRSRLFTKPKTPLEKSFAHGQWAASQGNTATQTGMVKNTDNVSKKSSVPANSKPDRIGLPTLKLDSDQVRISDPDPACQTISQPVQPGKIVPSSPRDRNAKFAEFTIPKKMFSHQDKGSELLTVHDSPPHQISVAMASGRFGGFHELQIEGHHDLSEVEEIDVYPKPSAMNSLKDIAQQQNLLPQPLAQNNEKENQPAIGTPASQSEASSAGAIRNFAGVKPNPQTNNFSNVIVLEDDDKSISSQSGILGENAMKPGPPPGSSRTVPVQLIRLGEPNRLQHNTTVDSVPSFDLSKMLDERNKKHADEVKSRPKAIVKSIKAQSSKSDNDKAGKKPSPMQGEADSQSNSQQKVLQLFRIPAPQTEDSSPGNRCSSIVTIGLPNKPEKMDEERPLVAKQSDGSRNTNPGVQSKKSPGEQAKAATIASTLESGQIRIVESPSQKMQLVEIRSGSTSLKRSDEPVATKSQSSMLNYVKSVAKGQDGPANKAPSPLRTDSGSSKLITTLSEAISQARTSSPRRSGEAPAADKPKHSKTAKDESSGRAKVLQYMVQNPEKATGETGAEEFKAGKQNPAKAKSKKSGELEIVISSSLGSPSNRELAGWLQGKPLGVPQVSGKAGESGSEDEGDSSRGPLTRSRASRSKPDKEEAFREDVPKEDSKKPKSKRVAKQ